MKNTFGGSVSLTLFGESHGPGVGAVLDGLAPGIPVRPEKIDAQLLLRRPAGKTGTARVEPDHWQILSGVYRGKTTGTPLCIFIPNEKANSADYRNAATIARPGHADHTALIKYHGFADPNGGGHFSGRLTAALVAAGAVLIDALARKGIRIGTHVARCAGINDRSFGDTDADIALLNTLPFAVLDAQQGDRMRQAIEAAAAEGDSVGGILETVVTGLPAGVGEPWFDTVEGVLSHALFSIPAVKGVQFGNAFDDVDLKGSEYNDPLTTENGRITTLTNRNGGVNGGITNGMPLVFRCAVKPTPSVAKTQQSVDLATGRPAALQIRGRHDPAIVHRARAVADSVTALALCDLLAQRFGTDYLMRDDES